MSRPGPFLEDQNTGDRSPIAQGRGKTLKLIGHLACKKEGNLKRTFKRLAGCQRRCEPRSIIFMEMKIDAQVIGAQRPHARQLAFGQRHAVAVEREAERRKRACHGFSERQAGRSRLSLWRLLALPCLTDDIHSEALPDTGAWTGRMRETPRERRAIGLERGIRPVALILHLEEIALEIEA